MELKKIAVLLFLFVASFSVVYSTQEQVRVSINEYVDQEVTYNPLETGDGIWYDTNENQSEYNLSGELIITNENPNGYTISDIYISFTNTGNITLPVNTAGRSGTFISNDTTSGLIVLHIPELSNGENSTWSYSINETQIRPALNMTSSYSDTKLLAGDNLTITDRVQNTFDSFAFQTDTCVYDIVVNQSALAVNFSGTFYDFLFNPSSVGGTDSGNVVVAADNKTLTWTVGGGGCLAQSNQSDISYDVETPLNIPSTTSYPMVNSTLTYFTNNSMSHLRVTDITAISEAEVSFEKQIISPSHPTLYGSNVTWNVTGYFNTNTNITYNLSTVTLWVSQRNVNGSYTDPNTIDNDTISNASLELILNPSFLVNNSQSWTSSNWLFNYSDIPSPIVWMDVNFSIFSDGTQLINRSVTRNNNDIYIKELYLIIGYWLEIEKNLTALSSDTYNIRIDVHNKGNQVTPADTVVTIYDFIPGDFNYTAFSYSTSPWYTTSEASNNVTGQFNGTLVQWGLLPSNSLNTSFAQGPAFNENTTWSVEYNVTGQGDYQLLDAFVTGLDPQQVDGAGSTPSTVVTEVIDRFRSTEGIFAAVASVLLLLGLLL